MNERTNGTSAIARIDLAHEADFTLGPIRVRPSRRELVSDGRRETLEPRVMRVLVALARALGDVLSRDDLIESCWDGVIVSEGAINRCVGQLRKIAEASGNAFAIQTVARVGYRLTAADPVFFVSELKNTAGQEAAPTLVIASSVPARSVRKTATVSAIAFLAIIVVGIAVWRFWPPGPTRIALTAPVQASIAILPFVNMSGDPQKEYFSDGFSEELINDLSNVPHVHVVSRTSSFAFKGKNENVKLIAGDLGVDEIVEGSVRESGDRVRITAQLINARDGYHVWSATYDRDLTDILSVQDELARAIAMELTHRLVPAPAAPLPKIDPEVYRLYLEGIREFNMSPVPGWRRSLAIFKKVTVGAPDFSDGFAWLARAAGDLAINYDSAPASDDAIAEGAAQRALSLDPHNTMARAFRALVEMNAWNWRDAAVDLRILRNRNPNNFFTVIGLENYYWYLGFPDEGFAVWRRGYALEPQTYDDGFFTLIALDHDGHFQEEIGVARAQLVRRPRDTARLDYLCSAYAATGQIAHARAVNERLRTLQADIDSQTNFQDCELYLDTATNNDADALKILHGLESQFPDKQSSVAAFGGVSAAAFGASYVLLGDFAKASDWFERAYERREGLFFSYFFLRGFGYEKAIEKYRLTNEYKALAEKPLFKDWQAEHDRVAAALAAHRDPLN